MIKVEGRFILKVIISNNIYNNYYLIINYMATLFSHLKDKNTWKNNKLKNDLFQKIIIS